MINFNQSPYFDDFDKDNKFYRILYRPSFAVQGRELTQSQSILQEQIKKFGDHIFQHGAMVISGQITFDKAISFQKMVSTYSGVDVNPVNFLGYTVIGQESGVEGIIQNVAPLESTDPLTFFMKFKDSGTNNESIGFWDGEEVYRKDNAQIRATVEGILNTTTPTYTKTGKAAITSIDEGIYYIDGVFVDVDKQSIVVSKYDQIPTAKIGLRVYETIITPEDNLALTDNAQGSTNYAAPGAHRYKIELKLESIDYEADISDDFVILQYLKQGEIVKEIRTTAYSELEKTFARRTFDESGDYTVNPFSIIMKEHLRDESDDQYKEGKYFAPTGDNTKLIAEMGIGKGYVQGHEISKISNSFVNVDKARDYLDSNNSITNFSLGNYIKVSDVHNIPRIDEFGSIQLYETVSTPGVNNGDLCGTAKVRAIKRFTSNAYLYIFDIEMVTGKNFEDDVKWIYDTNGNSVNNFTCICTIEDLKLSLYKVDSNKLIFELPHTNIKTLSVGGSGVDTNYQSTRAYFNTGIVGGIATLVANNDEVFQQNTADYYVSLVSTGVQVAFSPSDFTFSGSPNGKIVEIANLSGPVNIIAPVTKTIIAEKTKYLQDTGSITITSPNKKQNDRDYLGKADVVRVKNVYMSADYTTSPVNTDTDIRSRYQMDTGQRDNYYDVGSIILKGGENAPTGQILVEFDYFTHSAGDYFSVDSYSAEIDYDEIPTYISSESGGAYMLGDCFDFRPRMDDARTGFIGAGGCIGELPQVFTDIRSDYEYYLNRIDYLYLDYLGSFKIARGIPAIYPKPPEKPEMGMIVYELFINSYTFKPGDVSPTYKDNKRYTMRDIGDLDKRIGNLEYYTALSLLERETASMEILDQNGLNRFKNGFVVDPFDSHGVGNSTHSDYNCAIDPKEGKMRPKFNDENIGLLFDSINSTGVQKTGGIITLPYTESAINTQGKASKYENINPFAFRNIFGKVIFNPDSDVWHDKETLPTLVVNHSPNYEALKYIAENTGDLNGVEWERWNDVGGRLNTRTSKSISSSQSTTSRQDTGISHDDGWLQVTYNNTTTATTTWEQEQQREGVKQTHKDSNVISESLGNRITEMNYIPYMRSITILVKTEQLKKNTKVYPFFDGVSMSSHCDPASTNEYCTPASIINGTISGRFRTTNFNEERISGQTSGASAIVVFQNDNYLKVINIQGTFLINENIVGTSSGAVCVMSSIEIKNLGDAIISGESGEVALIWQVPNDDTLKFMTGEREFVLTDQITNADPVHTTAKGMFKSHGMSSKQEDTVLSTKTIKFTKENVRQSKLETRSTSTSSTRISSTDWYDPIAQSFLIAQSGGCFLTKVRVWFQSKDNDEGVVCEIRNMVNGYPAEIALTEVTLQPSQISISERAPGVQTDFVFPEPIYLKEGVDYCFVLKPAIASASYQVWCAENGRIDLSTGEIITGKESLGSLFKSQNASTWTADQNEDIMFTLYKAVFDINAAGTCQLVNDEIPSDLLNTNSLETYNGTERVRVYHKNHGLTVGSTYNLSGLVPGTDYNGFLGSQLNGEHLITDIEIDSFTFIILGTLGTETGLTGGSDVYGTRNYQLDLAHPLVNELIIDDTSVDWTMSTTTGTSINGSQTAYVSEPFIDVINNSDVLMTKPMIICSEFNETNKLSGAKSFKMVGTLKSMNSNVSPVVDALQWDSNTNIGSDIYFNQSSSTLIAVSNRVDFPDTTIWSTGSNNVFSVGSGEDELVIAHVDHELGTGAHILIDNFNDSIPGVIDFVVNSVHEIRVIDKDSYLVDMKETSTGYSGSGGGHTTISYSTTHFKYTPETKSFNCSTASRYMIKQVTLKDAAENFKLFFGAVRESNADIDVYYKTRSPYEVTEWNNIDWIGLDESDENVAISQSPSDFKDYAYTIEDIIPFNSIAIKLVMKSTDSTQVPIFQDFRLICTT